MEYNTVLTTIQVYARVDERLYELICTMIQCLVKGSVSHAVLMIYISITLKNFHAVFGATEVEGSLSIGFCCVNRCAFAQKRSHDPGA